MRISALPPYFLPLLFAATATAAAQTTQNDHPLVADKYTLRLMELGVATLLIIFVANFIYGSRKNATIATTVSKHLDDALQNQFAQIATTNGKKLLKDGQSFYWFYATGRRFTSGLTVAIDLVKRMDLFSYTSALMYSTQKDRCVFILPLTPDCTVDPISLFVVKKKELSRWKTVDDGQAINHVEALAGEVSAPPGIPSDTIVMSEHADVVSLFLPDAIRAVITQHSNNILSIHLATNGAKWEPQSKLSEKLIRVEFTLPSNDADLRDLLFAMTRITMFLLDQAGTAKVSSDARKKALDLRRQIASREEKRLQKERAEQAAKRKEEKKKEEEQAVGKMSRDKQIKYEEKKRKKQLSARMRKASKK